MRHWRLILIAAAGLLVVSACSNLPYYAQSARGHLALMAAREPVDELLSDPESTPDLKSQLVMAREIRDFASLELGLPDNGSYRSYVDLGRPYAVWNVFAAPKFSLQTRNWCFPIAGCVAYRGYFREEAANAFADDLRAEGLDVHVAGSTAYSTLGWFDDPLLNTMFGSGEVRLAGLVFHELAHQQVYVQDDTAFNEGFAVAVEEAGVRVWLERKDSAVTIDSYDLSRSYREGFLDLVESWRVRLEALYATDVDEAEMREQKAALIERMREDYRELKTSWGGYTGYDRWFNEPINNAKLAAIATYREHVPAFTRLLKNCAGDYQRFYARVEDIGNLDDEKREEALNGSGDCG
ncbi:MAG: aminopeptidase [Gammaproteobacteria bacterium]